MREIKFRRRCWADYGEYLRETDEAGFSEYLASEYSATCMLQAEHDGPHIWTQDDEISVTFSGKHRK